MITTENASISDFLYKIIASILSLFYDARVVLSAVLVLILLDQIVGVTYAVSKKQFCWKKFNKVFIKVIMYMVVIISSFVYERFLLSSSEIPFTKIIGALVGAKELGSSYMTFKKFSGVDLKEALTRIKTKI